MATPAPAAPAAPFGRVLVAMVTPFDSEGALDVRAAQRLAEHLVDTGCDGLVVSGTTGESATTSDAEKESLLRAVLEAVGERASVVAGVGTNDTRHTLELAAAAEKAGADGLLVVTPYYSKPPQAGLVRHFRAVADAASLPVMLYDIPGRTGVPLSVDTLLRLAEHERIVAVKDAKADFVAASTVMGSGSDGSGLAWYSGDDALNLPWLALGAAGVVSVVGHVVAASYARMVAAVDAGDLAEARRLHLQLLPLVTTIMAPTSSGAIMAKAALQARGLLPSRTTRAPLLDATDEQVTEARDALERLERATG